MYKRARRPLTTLTGSGAQPGLCFIVMEAVEPEVSDLRVGPNPPRLQRNVENETQTPSEIVSICLCCFAWNTSVTATQFKLQLWKMAGIVHVQTQTLK